MREPETDDKVNAFADVLFLGDDRQFQQALDMMSPPMDDTVRRLIVDTRADVLEDIRLVAPGFLTRLLRIAEREEGGAA